MATPAELTVLHDQARVIAAAYSVVRAIEFPGHPVTLGDALVEMTTIVKEFYGHSFGPLPPLEYETLENGDTLVLGLHLD